MYVLWRIIVKEFLQLKEDKRIIPLVFLAPVIQLLAFGYAANLDVATVDLLLVDRDQSPASRALVERFIGSPYFEMIGAVDSIDDIEPWLVDGRADAAIVIGANYGRKAAAGGTPEIQLIVDGSDSTSATLGLSYASGVIEGESARLLARRLAAEPGLRPGLVEVVPRVWYNPDLKSRWFFVPAVLAMILMILTMVLSSMGVVREKEIGTMEQLVVTPIKPWQLIIGKLMPFGLIGLIVVFLATGVAVLWFGVPLRGSLALLIALTMLLLLNTLGLGLLVSTIASNQQQAMMGSAFALLLPQVYLSGLIFPIANMPQAIQYATYAVPLRYYAIILRGIFLKGVGIDVLWPQALALGAFGVGFLSLAALRFQKRI
ncbi:MAG: ABC transporter permease [Acidobacteriota bacterium]|jgi:ABC-2 type transport system permease protein